MMSKKLEEIINQAIQIANEKKHEYLTLETVLIAMLDDDQVIDVLQDLGANIDQLQEDLIEFLNDQENFSILTDEQVQNLSRQQFVDEELRKLASENGIQYQPEISLSLQRVIQRAAIHVQSSGKRNIMGINILVSMFQEKESFALYSIQKYGIERFDVVKYIAHGADEAIDGEDDYIDNSELEGGITPSKLKKEKKENAALNEFCINLNELAKKNKIDPLIGRSEELNRIVEVLCRRRKNNPLLVGEAGVGKTAIVEGLAKSIVEGNVPEVLEETIIFSLDMAALLAGAKFRGDFEQRLKNVLKELDELHDKGEKTILFIDEIHTVMGAGATNGGSMDASNLLKPALSSGRVRCLGSTTHNEFRKFIEKDHAFSRRFQKIDVDEPSLEDTYQILKGLKPKFEEHHGVKYSNAVLRTAVDLSNKFLGDRKNPDKSIDVIDEVGAKIHLLPKSKRKKNISKKDVELTISKLAKIPEISVTGSDRDRLKNLKANLDLVIYGQDEAVEKVSDAIILSRSGLGHDSKPMANFLFAGPTGVGKTELARQLAHNLGSHLERFDMSEYMEKHSVAKLIGAPPGYVGYDNGGILTDAVKKNPHCILLLDEIEKAHPDIYNILLQVMDHGALTDSQGRTTDFKNTVIIMTTNAGAKQMEAGSIGLGQVKLDGNTAKRDQTLKNFFTPEFRNRLDAIIHFNKLGSEFIVKIVDKFLLDLENRLASKNVEIEVTESAKLWLAKTGYDPKMGARPIGRIIDQQIKKPLSNEVLFGELSSGGKVIVDLSKDEEITFKYQ
ncbi:ATP-dependent Clp protease ATP-binding subunit ClpA [Halobacteriovorax sp.]|uniref:ATP-dependent Clp protease ATP-binding subunit ClpA n=1 Tax=Halobacteriovorax sp. TaxID=2020862 RepID=UPI0035661B0E